MKIKVKCKRCEYSWLTKSKMFFVSCPRCNNKCKINKLKGGLDNGK